MNISTTPDTIFPLPKDKPREVVQTFSIEGAKREPEKSEEEKRLDSSTISFRKELTPEEENRVLFLKNLLAQLLTMSNGQPTAEQRARIKEIEKELEKKTGIKMRSTISDVTSKMPERDKDEEKEKWQARGIDPKDAMHSPELKTDKSNNPGMQMLQRNAFGFKLQGLIDGPSLSGVRT